MAFVTAELMVYELAVMTDERLEDWSVGRKVERLDDQTAEWTVEMMAAGKAAILDARMVGSKVNKLVSLLAVLSVAYLVEFSAGYLVGSSAAYLVAVLVVMMAEMMVGQLVADSVARYVAVYWAGSTAEY